MHRSKITLATSGAAACWSPRARLARDVQRLRWALVRIRSGCGGETRQAVRYGLFHFEQHDSVLQFVTSG
jgi:hypothetical protein